MTPNRDTCPEKASGLHLPTHLPASASLCLDWTCVSLLHSRGIVPRTSNKLRPGDSSHQTGHVKRLWQLGVTLPTTPQPFRSGVQTTRVKMTPFRTPQDRQQSATRHGTVAVSCGLCRLTPRKPLRCWGHAGANGPTSSTTGLAGESQEAPGERPRTSA